MVNKDITSFLQNENRIDELDYADISTWIEKYPYAQSLRFLLIKKEAQQNKVNPKSLAHAALASTDNHLPISVMNAAGLLAEQNKLRELLSNDAESSVEKQGFYIDNDQVEVELAVNPTVTVNPDIPEQTLDIGQLSDYSKWLIQLKSVDTLHSSPESIQPSIEPSNENSDVVYNEANEEYIPVKLADESNQLNSQIASESLASLFAEQGYKQRAIAMYEKLSLINSEKRAYFAAQIEKIKGK